MDPPPETGVWMKLRLTAAKIERGPMTIILRLSGWPNFSLMKNEISLTKWTQNDLTRSFPPIYLRLIRIQQIRLHWKINIAEITVTRNVSSSLQWWCYVNLSWLKITFLALEVFLSDHYLTCGNPVRSYVCLQHPAHDVRNHYLWMETRMFLYVPNGLPVV